MKRVPLPTVEGWWWAFREEGHGYGLRDVEEVVYYAVEKGDYVRTIDGLKPVGFFYEYEGPVVRSTVG